MARSRDGWRLRRGADGGVWKVRFRVGNRRVELSTHEREKTAALAVAEFLYRKHAGGAPTPVLPALEPPIVSGVYVVQGAGGYIKIGWGKNIARRIRAVQTGHPEPLRLIAMIPGTPATELELHRRLKAHRAMGEWFFPRAEVFSVIQAAWTCAPELPACVGVPKSGAFAR